MIFRFLDDPASKKRFLRFKETKRAYFSFWILVILYSISLCSELLCNNVPLYVRYKEKSYFPVFKFYAEDVFLRNGKKTRPDYGKINQLAEFKKDPRNFMIFPPVPYGPFESTDPDSIRVSEDIRLMFSPVPMIGTGNIGKDYSISRSDQFGFFIGKDDNRVNGAFLTEYYEIPKLIKTAVDRRFENKRAKRVSCDAKSFHGNLVVISLSNFFPRKRPPETVRLTFRQVVPEEQKGRELVFSKDMELAGNRARIWNDIPDRDKKILIDRMKKRLFHPVDPLKLILDNQVFSVNFTKKDVRFPFEPVGKHFLGIDGAGRDVLARVLYGLRTSLTFGLILVACSMAIGIAAGAFQGFYGGFVDLSGQRFIEIWSALPFLYVMILMGSVYGRSFSLLLFCYGLFNWIGISYYIRAEFLRLRRQPFVEAAKCMGISSRKIIFKHILPNAMVPVITFFPFSLVGAIGALAALDYLGFGLPPPTPSWGELLFQAQQFRWAWWLILYPSIALFVVMLLGVFIGEGIRNAYDPKKYIRLE